MTTNSISAQDPETVSVSTLLKNEMVTISVGDIFRVDMERIPDHVRPYVDESIRIEIVGFGADLRVWYGPRIGKLTQPEELEEFAKLIANKVLIKIPKDLDNNGRNFCCECGGLTTAISARKHFCPRCEK